MMNRLLLIPVLSRIGRSHRLAAAVSMLAAYGGVTATSQAQVLWHNDFSSSPNVASYVGANPNQADAISTTGSALAWSIEDEALKAVRSGSNTGAFSLTTRDWNSPALLIEMRVQVAEITSSGTGALYFGVGSGFNNNNAYPLNTNTHSDFSINFTNGSPDTFQFRDHGNNQNLGNTADGTSAIATGQWIDIWWGINNSGNVLTYQRPDGTFTTLNNDRWDLWARIDGVWHQLGDNILSANNNPGSTSLDDFKFYFSPNAQGTVLFDSITISGSLNGMSVPEPGLVALLLLSASACVRRRASSR